MKYCEFIMLLKLFHFIKEQPESNITTIDYMFYYKEVTSSSRDRVNPSVFFSQWAK
jgi:hypothetical protein